MRIVVDPGHGGKDPGACAGPVHESDMTLSVGKLLQQQFANEPGWSGLLTRDTDIYLSPLERAKFSNAKAGQLFVSIHCNSAVDPVANGIEVCYHPDSSRGQALADVVCRHLAKIYRKNRGVKPRPDLVVLHATHCPAILIEIGFLSNVVDRAMITDQRYQQSIANAIAAAVKSFANSRG
jgi:N-acetylmuramoyl-L-alanine amidase